MTYNLNKQNARTFSLNKGLRNVRMALGWDEATPEVSKPKGFFGRFATSSQLTSRPSAIDLDASALLFDARGECLDSVWFQQKNSRDGSIHHTGDNLTGAGEGDDESILLDLTRVPEAVTKIVFTVTSYEGQSFDAIDGAFCRLVDSDRRDTEIARYDLGREIGGPHTAFVMASLTRTNGTWSMDVIGEPASARMVNPRLIAKVKDIVFGA